MAVGGLDRYEAMRDFERTPEPAGSAPAAGDPHAPLTFVVQKHRASRLHYDLRLEVDGVMPSWPVPRGPAADTAEKRLAVMTEPHPLDYATFEGVIPAGQYGAGEVIVWDRGTYSPDEDGPLVFEDRDEANRRMREGIASGKVSVTLRGHRMKGSWALVKTQQASDSWLLIKHRDDAATGADLAEQFDTSVLSSLTIADLQGGRRPPEVAPPPLLAHEVRGAKRAPLPAWSEPMQASQTRDPFSHPDWLFEPKLDGIRAVATIEGGQVRLTSRRANDLTAGYPALAAALAKQPANTAVFDGEIVAFDERGVPSFERLQQRMNLTNPVEIRQADRDVPAVYFVFDLLYLDGVDLRRAPIEERRRLLERTLMPQPHVQLVEQFDVDGRQAYEAVVALGLEGLVAKKRGSTYTSGARSKTWLKVKQRLTDEFIVVGFTEGQNARSRTFGALHLATRDGSGRLVSVGRVGSGFDDATLRRASPAPRWHGRGRAGGGAAARTTPRPDAGAGRARRGGRVRAGDHGPEPARPVFLRVRDDKPASAVRAVPLVAAPAARRRPRRVTRPPRAPR
jgi:bifunctional non-homologous end joining protein LigD